jgi:protein-disulfide isomerase
MKIESLTTAALVVCALITTGLLAHRELASSTRSAASTKDVKPPALLPNWRDYLNIGLGAGDKNSPVQVIEFADFECPYCADFHKSLRAIEKQDRVSVGLTYVHFPIQGHRFAIPAARAAECAGKQGRFEAMHDQLFEGQDQFGLKAWDDYATAASVPDLEAFDKCIKKTDLIPRVEEGKALGLKLDVQGTPTIIINGWKLGRPPTEAELDQMVQRILAGKRPVDGKS